MTKQEFIDKWNIGYESLEQKSEFAADMEADLNDVFEQMRMNEFSKGYICACAEIIKQHGETTLAKDVLSANFMSIRTMRLIGVDKTDIEALRPVIKEIERHQNLSSPRVKE